MFYSSTDTRVSVARSGCLSPFRSDILDIPDVTKLTWAKQLHPDTLKLGAEVIGFMMDFYPNFETLYPWMDKTRTNLLDGTCTAAMPDKPLYELTARDMHIAVMVPRWLGEGYSSGAIILDTTTHMVEHYKTYTSNGINPLVAWAMSYMSCSSPNITHVNSPVDQSPFNCITGRNFSIMADRLIEINNENDTSYIYCEDYVFWTEVEKSHPKIRFDAPSSTDVMIQNAGNLQNAMDSWRASL